MRSASANAARQRRRMSDERAHGRCVCSSIRNLRPLGDTRSTSRKMNNQRLLQQDNATIYGYSASLYSGGRNSLTATAAGRNHRSRSKYNTLTPAEAKNITRYWSNGSARLPTRTASVLHKPRAPPMVITNLDDYGSTPNGSSSTTTQRDSPSHDDSESNLSFRSSLDVVDSAYGSNRLQTMSVDLGNPFVPRYKSSPNYNTINNRYSSLASQYCDFQESNKLSDDSYTSAVSEQSENSATSSNKLKSASKTSLSSASSKVFHNQLGNLKRFLRNMPIRRSMINGTENLAKKFSSNQSDRHHHHQQQQPSLSEAISQVCLSRSQSPPICPPPPGELKSMSYLENSATYSNYDEFTRARNERTSAILNGGTISKDYRVEEFGLASLDNNNDSESWHLASLPLSYERNLTTVFEEKQNNNSKGSQTIKPPPNFEDKGYETAQNMRSTSTSNSSQSSNSIASNDSVLDFHRQIGTSFRFSYAQPNAFGQQNTAPHSNGLPPRMPTCESKPNVIMNGNNCQNGLKNCETDRSSIDDGITDGLDNMDADTTILSDASTINGDSNHAAYVNKCAELNNTIESLKNKLLTKEKELTDLQLKQWSSDYLIDQLKSTVSRLEKENAQLRIVVAAKNR